MNNTVNLIGVRADGTSVNLGKITMPPEMKAREIVGNYVGSPGDPADDFDNSEATQAYRCCLDVIAYMRAATPPQAAPVVQLSDPTDQQMDMIYRDVWTTVPHAKRLFEFGRRVFALAAAPTTPKDAA